MSRKEFFEHFKFDGLSFSDVLLRPRCSEINPSDADISSYFSRRIKLPIPITSSPMDRVTGARLAIALAKEGGMGVLHRAMSLRDQVKLVGRVKNSMYGIIPRPICVRPNQTIGSVLAMKEERGFKFDSFPVTNGDQYDNGKLLGVITSNDFDFFRHQPDITVEQVMTKDLVTANSDDTVQEVHALMCKRRKKVIPLVDSKGHLTGLCVFSDAERAVHGNTDQYCIDKQGRLRVAAAIGTDPNEDHERAIALAEEGVDALVIDTAHGDSKAVHQMLTILKQDSALNDVDIVVGNVSSGPAALRLANLGADGVKVGQGVGSICTTRIISGVGLPQTTAVYECAEAVHDTGTIIIADGGIEYSGQITLAIAAGAHSVMIGGLFAGVDESPAKRVYVQGIPYMEYRGMGSQGAMEEFTSSLKRYGQAKTPSGKSVPEGIEGRVPYRGALADLVFYLTGGLRSGMGYVGCKTIKEMHQNCEFVRISSGGLRESHPHGVMITEDAPNYDRRTH